MSTRRFGALRARAPQAGDAVFLAALYLSARPELGALPVPRTVIEGIARHQQAMQAADYARAYPDAEEWIVEDEAGPLARLVLDRSPAALRVVDLSVAPRARRRGHARTLLGILQAEAAQAGQELALRVRTDNGPARRLYAGLGFQPDSEDGASRELVWRASQNE